MGRAPRAWLAAPLALLAVPQAGCPTTCVGAGCAETFAGALAGVLRGADQPTGGETSPRDTSLTVEGPRDLGPDWALTLTANGLLIGVPEDGSLRSFEVRGQGVRTPDDALGTIQGDADARFGAALATVPDLDGDGAAELAVGAPSFASTTASRGDGAVYLLWGQGQVFTGAQELASLTNTRIEGAQSAGLGQGLWACADLTGDGLEDLAMAAPLDDRGAALAGSIAVVSGADLVGRSRILAEDHWRWASDNTGARAGSSLACAHDLTGDGQADLLVGAPFADAVPAEPESYEAEGAAFVISGAPESGTLEVDASHTFRGLSIESWAGASVATGFLNEDALPEVVIGAPGYEQGAGMALIWRGDQLDDAFPTHRITGDAAGDRLGRALALDDLDGDGLDDLFVGAPQRNPTPEDDAAYDSGTLYVWFGTAGWLGWSAIIDAAAADLVYVEASAYLRTGQQIATGDVDGDDKIDLALLHRHDPG